MTDGGELVGGDFIRGPGDYYRLLKRAKEYLVEADRQLRDGGTPEEYAQAVEWYAEMDEGDEWTGMTAEAHVACAYDTVLFFQENPKVVEEWEGKPVLYEPLNGKAPPERHVLRIKETLDEVMTEIKKLSSRIDAEKLKN
ncbi:MAG: hypothetical protein ACRBCJ_11220 [Hyphomicrobiaceae bacterium]